MEILFPDTTTGAVANSNPIAANNQIAADASGDVCSKSLLACTLRNNQLHFGGFPGTGRTIPKRINVVYYLGFISMVIYRGKYALCCFTSIITSNNLLVENLSPLEAFNSSHHETS